MIPRILRTAALALAVAAGLSVTAGQAAAASAPTATFAITIDETTLALSDRTVTGMGMNDSIPGPTLRFTEGQELEVTVTNRLDEDTSIHWHGLILPSSQDGVPGLSFHGIKPGESHTYRFPAQQSGTYWYHSHSGHQEQRGVYGAIVIEPKAREPFRFDREYVVMLSDWHDTDPNRILSNLKRQPDYYNRGQRTAADFFADAADKGLGATLSDRADWGGMRMMPTDIADVSGYTFLVNGRDAAQNWTGLFAPGERVRLRFINAAAMTIFDVRIPGLPMTVVHADGNAVRPVPVDEFRIAVGETYDVIVRPTEDRAYTLFAESLDRAGYARATLAPREGMTAEVPALRPRPQLTMADMNHGDGGHAGHDMGGQQVSGAAGHGGMDHGSMGPGGMDHSAHGGGGAKADPFYAPGSGLVPSAADGGKVLSYADLKAQTPLYPARPPTREIEIRLTGNMERYIWSINGRKYSDAEPIRLQYGERVRIKFVNETMMTHPMHLHGLWTILDTGAGDLNPAKHVVSVAPATTVYAEVEADQPGRWAFHCHLMFHMATGMFREVIVEGGPAAMTPAAVSTPAVTTTTTTGPTAAEGTDHAAHH
ncbi:copper resistance system multicopper oxidase [Caenispirillum bisanense]|uniref:L-ascorbate oxidase n=1 Tax=Caenispirillum bisanense TaxID=414052 RepID=A0A286GWN9_9PROT|nr:copper resistance system multicopper oxidase [Caenispirillum bisanense]SOD99596.1 L-ascorbate oxidase [Caenispirillum bisanense]